jgi:hypothetical protein
VRVPWVLGVSMRRLLGLTIALSLPSAASAANWAFVANCGQQHQLRAYFYDTASLRRQRGSVIVRLRGDYSQVAGSRSKEAQLVWAIDCANRTFVERSRKEFGADRLVVVNYGKATGAMGITNNSIAEKLATRVCG